MIKTKVYQILDDLLNYDQNTKVQDVFLTHEEYLNIIRWLNNWMAAGKDRIFNFLIRK